MTNEELIHLNKLFPILQDLGKDNPAMAYACKVIDQLREENHQLQKAHELMIEQIRYYTIEAK